MNDLSVIAQLPSGVPGLDALLGGGLAEFSFNMIAGEPGVGKTTLAHQIMFSLASPQRRALFFTVLGEPAMKMLRYQQQFSWFDAAKLDDSIRYVNLSEELVSGDFDDILARIEQEVQSYGPGLVFVDSFRSMTHVAQGGQDSKSDLRLFTQRLGIFLSSWQATTFLIGEYVTLAGHGNPVVTVADGVLLLSESHFHDSMVRKIEVKKVRGQPILLGRHTYRISRAGIHVFPRTLASPPTPADQAVVERQADEPRLSMGVPVLDEMMGGGLPAGFSLLIAGPSGSGKSVLATQFILEGIRAGEKGVVAAFEKSPGRSRNPRLDELVASGQVELIDMRALDLSIDETLFELTQSIRKSGAMRVVIDSLAGFELALAPNFRADFREALYRLVSVLTGMGATVLLVSEVEDRYSDLRFSPSGEAFLTDAIIIQRYVEFGGKLRRVISVVKVRNSEHSNDLRFFEITSEGVLIGEPTPEIAAMLTGHPKLASDPLLSKKVLS